MSLEYKEKIKAIRDKTRKGESYESSCWLAAMAGVRYQLMAIFSTEDMNNDYETR